MASLSTLLRFVCLLVAPCVALSQPASPYQRPSDPAIADALDWQQTDTLCRGHFVEPQSIKNSPAPGPDTPVHITSAGPATFSAHGNATLKESVQVRQGNRLSGADAVTLYRDPQTGELVTLVLSGHVRVQQPGQLLVASQATHHLKKETTHLQSALYHFTQISPQHHPSYEAYGSAQSAEQTADKHLILTHATYSTCNPESPSFTLHANRIEFDRTQKVGYARGATLRIKHVPIFYFPYVSFSTDHHRKSGLLTPKIETDQLSGQTLSVPFYWNIAPNADSVFTPIYYSKRGYALKNDFRYIDTHTQLNTHLAWIPKDNAFGRFKTQQLAEFPAPVDPILAPYLNELQSAGTQRAFFSLSETTRFNPHWQIETHLNYVTDPYYLRDFGSNANETQANQLLNQIRFSYQDADWDVHLTNQLYQTLHLIDQLSIPTYNQYMRLPELNAHYYHFYQGVDINLNSDATHFAFDSAFPPETGTLPTGFRAHLRPSIGKTLFWKGTYIHPSLAVDQVAYQLDQGSASSYQHARTTPIVQIDSGMYLHEDAHWFGNTYEHIVEPRLFYLYVPYQNQNQLPNFDTQLLPFSYLQLFQINRFIGPDRFQNANQISLGISSRLLSQDDGREKIAFEIGSGYYFTQPRVCTTTPCVIPDSHAAPIASHLRLTPTRYPWAIETNATYEPAKKELDNLSVGLAYHNPKNQQMLRMDYTYLHANANTINTTDTSLDEDTSLYHLRFALPVHKQWHTLAGVYYNQTEHRFENYFGALEYHSCCLSLRLMLNRIFLGQGLSETGTQLRSRYNTQYIIQLKFNGIGSAGNRDISSLLKTELPEYSDPFKY